MNPAIAIGNAKQESTQLRTVAERLDNCTNDLSQHIVQLESRLESVLNPVNHTASNIKEVQPPSPVRCAYGSEIDGYADRVYIMTTRVRELLDRLAV